MSVDEEIINSSVSKPSREYSRSIQGRVKGSLSLSPSLFRRSFDRAQKNVPLSRATMRTSLSFRPDQPNLYFTAFSNEIGPTGYVLSSTNLLRISSVSPR